MNNGSVKGFRRRRYDAIDMSAGKLLQAIWSKHLKRRGIPTAVDIQNERARQASKAAGFTSYSHLHPTKGYKVKPV